MPPSDFDKLEKLHDKLNRKLEKWERKKLKALLKSFREAEKEIKALLVTAADWEKVRLESLLAEVDRIIDKLAHEAEMWVKGRADVEPGNVAANLSQYPAIAGGNAALTSIGISATFSTIHMPVLSYMQDYNLGLIKNVTHQLREQIKEQLKRGYIMGDSIQDIAKRLRDTKLNKGVWPSVEKRAEVIARTEIIRASNQGALTVYKQYDVKRVRWLTAADERVCSTCGPLHRRVFPIDQIPFGGPPAHPRCYDKDTEVYTDRGWLKFSELSGAESFLSLNTETHQPEWVPAKQVISYPFAGEMVRFRSNSLDIKVTPDHEMYVGIRHFVSGQRVTSWRFEEAGKLPEVPEFKILKTCNWEAKSPDIININGLKFKPEVFAKFMGYYLSEGSVVKRSENNYCISINQEKPETFKQICEDLQDMPVKTNPGKGRIYINNKALGQYVEKLGLQPDRYVPNEVKQLPRDLLKAFLKAYVLGDGSVKTTNWKEKQCVSVSEKIDTCSTRMADDLGEVILKAGYYPSFALRKIKGKTQKFHNGTYTINHDVWVIYINRRKTSIYEKHRKMGVKITTEPYEGLVYCVELIRNHVIWVRRNGKTAWCGNCRCFIVSHIAETEEEGKLADIEAKKNANDFKDGKLTDKKKSETVRVPKSLGAAAKRIYVKEPILLKNESKKWIKEGTYLTKIKSIYEGTQIRDINKLIEKFPLQNGTFTKPDDWSKMIGRGIVTDGKRDYKAEIHWYQGVNIGKVDWKIKKYLNR